MTLEKKFKTLSCLSEVRNLFQEFTLDWEFHRTSNFDDIVKELLSTMGELDKDVYYITNTEIDIEALKNLTCGTKMEFGKQSVLERINDCSTYTYLYYTEKPTIFGLHIHKNHIETVEAVENEVSMYVPLEDGSYKIITLYKGQSYTIPKGVQHAAVFSKNKTVIKITWS
jgi:hypothetical protein